MRIRVRLASSDPNSIPNQRRGEPITFGVPLPRGSVTGEALWTLRAGDREAIAQARILDRWPDGSARWVLVDAQIDLAAGGPRDCEIECRPLPSAAPEARARISVAEHAGTITVDTGAARFTIGGRDGFPFQAVQVAGSDAIAGPRSTLTVIDAAGTPGRVAIDAVEVEERGPLRTVVRMTGTVPAGPRGERLTVTARAHFFAGLPAVRLLVTLTNHRRAEHKGGFWDLGDPGSILIKDASLTVALPGIGTGAVVHASAEPGRAATYAVPFEIYQDSSGGERWQSTNHMNRERRVPNTFRGYRVRAGGPGGAGDPGSPRGEDAGLRATPVVVLERGRERVAAAVPEFWQNFPRAVEADVSSLTLRLFPGQYADLYELQGGEQKTYEAFLSFGHDPVTEQPLDWCRARTVGCVDPDWCASTGAIAFLAPLDARHRALVDVAVDGPEAFDRKREVIDEYGWRNFGDVYGDHESIRQPDAPLVSHYNNQYDVILGFASQFVRTGDPRWRRMMTELSAHVVDIDVYHTDEDRALYNRGLFWHTYHYGDADTATHRSYPKSGLGHVFGGGPSADHNYTTGLMLQYFLTGDEAARETAVDLAQFVLNMEDGRKTIFRWLDRGDTGLAALSNGYYGPGRGPANSVNALVDGYRLTGRADFRAKLEQLIRRVVHPEEDITRHRLDEPEERWFYMMFLQSLGKYLHDKVERGELDAMYAYGRESLLHYARWMAVHEYPYLDKPEKLTFPTETWAAQDIRKSDIFAYAAMHATGDERARFAERAEFFHRHSIETLEAKPTRRLARPVIVLLTSGVVHEWFEAHAGASEPAPEATASFGPPQIFVPQRKRAERNAMILAGAAAIGTIALLAKIFL